jgi:hypothetical protein
MRSIIAIAILLAAGPLAAGRVTSTTCSSSYGPTFRDWARAVFAMTEIMCLPTDRDTLASVESHSKKKPLGAVPQMGETYLYRFDVRTKRHPSGLWEENGPVFILSEANGTIRLMGGFVGAGAEWDLSSKKPELLVSRRGQNGEKQVERHRWTGRMFMFVRTESWS